MAERKINATPFIKRLDIVHSSLGFYSATCNILHGPQEWHSLLKSSRTRSNRTEKKIHPGIWKALPTRRRFGKSSFVSYWTQRHACVSNFIIMFKIILKSIKVICFLVTKEISAPWRHLWHLMPVSRRSVLTMPATITQESTNLGWSLLYRQLSIGRRIFKRHSFCYYSWSSLVNSSAHRLSRLQIQLLSLCLEKTLTGNHYIGNTVTKISSTTRV